MNDIKNIDKIITIKDEDGFWFIELSKNIEFFLPPEEFPLNVQFLNSYIKKIIWESKLNPSTWVSFPSRHTVDLQISTKSNKVLYYIPFNKTKYFDLIEDIFYNCILTHNLKNGVVVGAGDGSFGEWLNPVIKGVDIEKSNREFFICPEWLGISSVIKENILNFKIEEKNILSEMIECESLNFLLKKDSYDWLRLDVEGLDSSLIFSLDKDVLKSLKYIQYEHINITEEDKIKTNIYLESNGFKVFMVNIDMVAIKL